MVIGADGFKASSSPARASPSLVMSVRSDEEQDRHQRKGGGGDGPEWNPPSLFARRSRLALPSRRDIGFGGLEVAKGLIDIPTHAIEAAVFPGGGPVLSFETERQAGMHQFQQFQMGFRIGQCLVQRHEKSDACRPGLKEPGHHALSYPAVVLDTGQVADDIVGRFAQDEFGDAAILFGNACRHERLLEPTDKTIETVRQRGWLDLHQVQPNVAQKHQHRRGGRDERVGRAIGDMLAGVDQVVQRHLWRRIRGLFWLGPAAVCCRPAARTRGSLVLGNHGAGRTPARHVRPAIRVENRCVRIFRKRGRGRRPAAFGLRSGHGFCPIGAGVLADNGLAASSWRGAGGRVVAGVHSKLVAAAQGRLLPRRRCRISDPAALPVFV